MDTPRRKRRHSVTWNRRGNNNLGWNDVQMYFKVIKSGTNRKLVYAYDFLSVVYSNFCRRPITHRFWEIWCETVQWPWNMPNVIDSRITWNMVNRSLSINHGGKVWWKRHVFEINQKFDTGRMRYSHSVTALVIKIKTRFECMQCPARWLPDGLVLFFRRF